MTQRLGKIAILGQPPRRQYRARSKILSRVFKKAMVTAIYHMMLVVAYLL